MKYFFLIVVLISFLSKVFTQLLKINYSKFKNTKNLSFNFEQNINGKLENGNCTIEYPKNKLQI